VAGAEGLDRRARDAGDLEAAVFSFGFGGVAERLDLGP